MKISSKPPVHLTYCLNVHPGETWDAAFRSIRDYTLAVRDRVATDQPFGLGLRLGIEMLDDLERPGVLDAFTSFLAAENLYVFTVNGFPYGTFHGERVKEKVYAPDWRTPERRAYTCRIADVLAELLPAGESGSISTVPGSYKRWIRNDADVEDMVRGLVGAVQHLVELEQRTGREIHLGLEPEPDCYVETTGEAVAFFKEHLLGDGVPVLADGLRCSTGEAERLLRRHLGVCLDTCHVAVQFEDLTAAVRQLKSEGIRLSKVQLSAALETDGAAPGLAQLGRFREPVYLHQTRALAGDGSLSAWPDLDEALAELEGVESGPVVRVHFHVPISWAGSETLRSTVGNLSPAFIGQLLQGVTSHLEIETYTFDVLPPEMREPGVVGSVVGEYQCVLKNIRAVLPA
jgi:sugar phosphate isomerase/epimerase